MIFRDILRIKTSFLFYIVLKIRLLSIIIFSFKSSVIFQVLFFNSHINYTLNYQIMEVKGHTGPLTNVEALIPFCLATSNLKSLIFELVLIILVMSLTFML